MKTIDTLAPGPIAYFPRRVCCERKEVVLGPVMPAGKRWDVNEEMSKKEESFREKIVTD